MFLRRVLCGIQPSSVPHIGNYLGAVKKWIDLQNSGDNLIVMLADLHAITIPREPDAFRKSVLETTASLLACGIDPKRSLIYRQSDLYHHTQLAWLLGTLTTVQKVGHNPTYKSKVKDDSSTPLGLFLYPVLQAADILLLKTTHLPIGEDQIAHLQLCTYIIEKFYHYYKQNIFPVPQMMATETNRVRSLRHPEQKMSKSDFEERSRIDIMDDEKNIQERVMKALTDFNAQVSYDREARPGVSNLIDIYAGITDQSIEAIVAEAQRDNLNTAAFKKRLAEVIIEHFRPKRVEYLKLMNDPSYLLSILNNGRERAGVIADKTLNEILKKNMNAFETELGVLPEIARAVDEMGWLLPTDVQSEAIPMILGGGDVLMAAETGSGKTGAFCLPILQIVHETLRDIQEGNKGPPKGKQTSTTDTSNIVQLSFQDRSHGLAIDTDGLTCQSRDQRIWNGARSTKGVKGKGRYYFEVTQTEPNGIVRVGWSVPAAQRDLGTDNQGFGYGGTGKKSFAKQFDDYGETFGINDVIGSLIDLDQMKIRYFKNGKDLGHAFDIPRPLQENTFFAHVCLKSCDVRVNFGAQPFQTTPTGAVPIGNAPKECSVESQVKSLGNNTTAKQRPPNAPLAIILEPSRELAQQTLDQIQVFQKYLENPRVRELVIIGGVSVGEQTRVLRQGVDIIVATPGRLEELIGGGEIDLAHMRFFILDEADGLLSQGYKDFIMRLHNKMPSVTLDGKRLQMIVCSATLHNFEVKKLADSIMHFPTWVDLKGQDAVPETVHHVVCMVDPKKNKLWRGLRNHIKTDDVHLNDQLNYQSDSKETLSEAIKILKGEYCLQAIDRFKMDRALIFCRTKLDCDNLERYFIKQGGGPKANKHRLSCVCLHSDRSADERQNNLQRFKDNEVRFLICTDVAARGIDVSGLPFVINMTLPDEKESYIHRIGRVGRAERMGLAISFVSTVPEKVWYHTCPSKGKNCHNTKLLDQHGCCKWYTELTYLADIEEHLGVTISQTDEKMDIPVDEFDGKVTYGEKRKQEVSTSKGHVDTLAPTVGELLELEKRVQTSFFALRNIRNILATS